MSSHHFVKEGQEPALFIVDVISLSQVEPLLEWAPLVMVLDTVLDVVLTWGIKIDVILAKGGSLAHADEKINVQWPLKILSYNTGDEPISVGLNILGLDQSAVNVTSQVNDKVFWLAEQGMKIIDVALFDDTMKWAFIHSGNFEKWFPSQTLLLIRSTASRETMQFFGLSDLGNNTVKSVGDGKVIVKSSSPFWVGEWLA